MGGNCVVFLSLPLFVELLNSEHRGIESELVPVSVQSLSLVRLFATPWTPGSSVRRIFQA